MFFPGASAGSLPITKVGQASRGGQEGLLAGEEGREGTWGAQGGGQDLHSALFAL